MNDKAKTLQAMMERKAWLEKQGPEFIEKLTEMARKRYWEDKGWKERPRSEDPFVTTADWIKETGLSTGDQEVEPEKLFQNFCAWSKSKNISEVTMTAFGRAIKPKLPKKRTKKGVRYLLNKQV